MPTRARLLAAALALALAAGAGGALASGTTDRGSRGLAVQEAHGRIHSAGLLLRTASDHVGLSRRELVARLRRGESLADVARAEGKTVEGLKDALLRAVRARLDRAVANGRISEARRDRVLQRLATRIDRLVERKRS